jgi:sialidase-1
VGGIPGGEGGTAVEFAGGSVECSTVPDLTGDWTVAFWLKTTSTANSTIYYRGGAGASSKQFYVAYFGGSGGVLNVGVPDVIGLINSVGSVNDGAWHHVAVRREGDVWTLFIDGAVDSTVTNGVGQGSHPLTQIGTGTLGSFAGVLDEFAVWGTALSDARIIAHHLAGV